MDVYLGPDSGLEVLSGGPWAPGHGFTWKQWQVAMSHHFNFPTLHQNDATLWLNNPRTGTGGPGSWQGYVVQTPGLFRSYLRRATGTSCYLKSQFCVDYVNI